MRAALVIAGALCAGCGLIDDFNPFHVIGPDEGDMAVADLAGMPASEDLRAADSAGTDLAVADLAAPDLAVPDLSTPDLAPCGVCKPGEQRLVACGNCGMETDTCTMACQWSAGACNGQGACAPNAMMGCGNCGTATCGNNCQWGACAGQGPCAPNAMMACGNCGAARCGNDCKWAGCNGEGPCSPNQTRNCQCTKLNCGGGQGQSTCGQNCQWIVNNAGFDVCLCGQNLCN